MGWWSAGVLGCWSNESPNTPSLHHSAVRTSLRCPVSEPRLRLGSKGLRLAAPLEANFARVQSVVRQDKPLPLLRRQPVLHQGQVEVLVTSIQFVSYDRMADMRQMNPDLVLAPRVWPHEQQSES